MVTIDLPDKPIVLGSLAAIQPGQTRRWHLWALAAGLVAVCLVAGAVFAICVEQARTFLTALRLVREDLADQAAARAEEERQKAPELRVVADPDPAPPADPEDA